MKNKGGAQLTDVDVLCGRGSGITTTPGNIWFRKLVDAHRERYVAAKRTKKLEVAVLVIQAVHKAGGRFLRVDERQNHIEVVEHRALEKTCQALREQVKSSRLDSAPKNIQRVKKQQNSSKNVKGKVKSKPASVRSSQTVNKVKREESSKQGKKTVKAQQSQSKSMNDVHESSSEARSPETSVQSDVGYLSQEDNNEESRFDLEWTPYRTPDPGDNNWTDMCKQLELFRSTFGHCGVPMNWIGNPELADWVCCQRQIYREIHSGYRPATSDEESRWKRLQLLHFILDYDDWHWLKKYNQLVESLKGSKYHPSCSISLSLRQWVEKQQKEYRLACEGRAYPMPQERQANLNQLGLFDETQIPNDNWFCI